MKRKHQKQNRKDYSRGSLVDVLIPVYNRFDIFQKCLDALPAAFGDIPYTVKVLDNASDPKDADEFYSRIHGVFVHRSKENLGFPRSCNTLARHSESPLILFLNSDVILHPGCIDYMVRDFDDPEIGVVGMKLLFPNAEELFDAGLKSDGRMRPADKIQHIGMSSAVNGEIYHHFIGWDADHSRPNRVRKVLSVTGAALMTRRLLYNKVGGFDEMYGLGTFEDVDYCFKIQAIQKGVIVETKSVGIHYTSATAEKYQHQFPLNENKMKFMARWAGRYPWTEWEIL